MTSEETNLLNDIIRILGWIQGEHKKDIPGWFYDNDKEYKDLVERYVKLKERGIRNSEVEDDFIFMKSEIDEAERRKSSRTPEEQEFYLSIRGDYSWLREQKETRPGYDWEDVFKMKSLLDDFEQLNSHDPDILEILRRLARDIKKTAPRYGEAFATKYQERFNKLGIDDNTAQHNQQLA